MSSHRRPDIAAPDEVADALLPHGSVIASALEGAGAGWLVGGVVRDAMLGRALSDIDVAVDGDADVVARRIARAHGGAAFPLSERHGAWRVTAHGGDGVQYDISELRAVGIDDDLRARDLTINAMAWSCGVSPGLVDVTGGSSDLEAGLVRMVSPQSYLDDPLRLIRTARVAHELRFDIDAVTVAEVRSRASSAVDPAGERTFLELERILLTPEARRGVRLVDDLGLLAVLIPELDACRGLEQSRFHHLDVFEHSLAVLDNAEDIIANIGFHLGRPEGCPDAPLERHEQMQLLLAALLHDIGKPATHKVDPNSGRPSFVGHDSVGAELVAEVCSRWATSSSMRDGVVRLVDTHLDLGWLVRDGVGRREAWRFLRATEPVAPQAIMLSVADRLATAGAADRRAWVRRHVETARALWEAVWRERRDGIDPPLLDGLAVAEAAGIEPGPELGRLVRSLAEEQAAGTVTTVGEARDFVRGASADTRVR